MTPEYKVHRPLVRELEFLPSERRQTTERVESGRGNTHPVQFLREEKLEPWHNGQVVPGLAYDDICSRVAQEAGMLHGGHDRSD